LLPTRKRPHAERGSRDGLFSWSGVTTGSASVARVSTRRCCRGWVRVSLICIHALLSARIANIWSR